MLLDLDFYKSEATNYCSNKLTSVFLIQYVSHGVQNILVKPVQILCTVQSDFFSKNQNIDTH